MNVEIGTEATQFPEKEYINAVLRIRNRNFWPDLDPIWNRNKRFGSGFESGSETGFKSGTEIKL
jgi:hypothetical protein